MKYFVFLLAVFLSAVSLFAQSGTPPPAQAAASAPAWSPSKDIGVFVFGKNGQTADQQLKDETDCYAAARRQSGIDPKASAPAGKTAEQKQAEQKAAAQNADAPSGAV